MSYTYRKLLVSGVTASALLVASPLTSYATDINTPVAPAPTENNNALADTSTGGVITGEAIAKLTNSPDLFSEAERNAGILVAHNLNEVSDVLDKLAVGQVAVVPVLTTVYPYADTSMAPIAGAKPNKFYSYRVVKKNSDNTTFKYNIVSRINTLNAPEDKGDYKLYSVFIPETINATYWLDETGAVAYKGSWTSNADKIKVASKGYITMTGGTGVKIGNTTWAGNVTKETIMNTSMVDVYYHAVPVTETAALTLAKDAFAAPAGTTTLEEALIANVQAATTTTGTPATYTPYENWAKASLEGRSDTYTISVLDQNNQRFGLSSLSTLPAGTYTVEYSLMRVASENPVNSFAHTMNKVATLTVNVPQKDAFTPEFPVAQGNPGQTVALPPATNKDDGAPLPQGTTITTTDDGVTIGPDGSLSILIPADATPGTEIQKTVTINYPDGTKEDVVITITVTAPPVVETPTDTTHTTDQPDNSNPSTTAPAPTHKKKSTALPKTSDLSSLTISGTLATLGTSLLAIATRRKK